MNRTGSSTQTQGVASAIRRFVVAPVEPQTYKNLIYLMLAFPLGIVYFVCFISGGALGLGLLITVVGLPILLVTISGATLAAGLEASLATRLVGVQTSVPAALGTFDWQEWFARPGNGFVTACKRLVTATSTWTSIVVVLSKFVFGLLSLVALVTSGALTGALLAAPFIYDDPDATVGTASELSITQYNFGPWVVDTLPEAIGVAAVGVVFLVVSLNLLNGLARLQAQYTRTLLETDTGPL
ncbi:sensor domain-containing protein [Halovenus rubra]|uniref:Sensor domain-containing protein n=2 Tax=Halovenus rubra TaxID=869890 RepID=A0ACC7E318_9EURY|nr:sensor domain-containing protein [Halovenus rubra]